MNKFEKLLKFSCVEQDSLSAFIAVEVSEECLNDARSLHGGFIASILDSVSGYAGKTVLPSDRELFALQLNINFLRTVSKGKVKANANVVRSGLQVLNIDSELIDDNGLTIANARGVWLIQKRGITVPRSEINR